MWAEGGGPAALCRMWSPCGLGSCNPPCPWRTPCAGLSSLCVRVIACLRGGPHPGLSVPRLTGSEPLTILPLTLEPEAAAQAHYKACDRLKLERKQRRMCRRDPGVAETLVEAVSMSALECQYQFRFERWNCTLEGRYRASLLKRGECARGASGQDLPAGSVPLAGSQGTCGGVGACGA